MAAADLLARLEPRRFVADALACVLALLLFLLVRRQSANPLRRFPLPPGPKTSWLGRVNLPTPAEYPWKQYAKWRKTYGMFSRFAFDDLRGRRSRVITGDVIYLSVLRNPIIILNTREAARALLEKRGGLYASRPIRTMVNFIHLFSLSVLIRLFATW